jgi:FMN phosphatase YigB (HAD superfamily)
MNDYTVYFDMDGVLTHFSHTVEEVYGEYPIKDDHEYEKFMANQVDNHDFFRNLKPSPFLSQMISFMSDMSSQFNVEILTSYGGWNDSPGRDAEIHKQKVDWLEEYVLSQFPTPVLNDFHGVANCSDKYKFGRGNSFLIDDSLNNCSGFRDEDGQAYWYEIHRHHKYVFKEIINQIHIHRQ